MNNKKQKQNNNCNAQYTVVIKQNKTVQEYNVIKQIRMIIKKNPGKNQRERKNTRIHYWLFKLQSREIKLKAEFKKQRNIRKIRTLKAMGNIKPTFNPLTLPRNEQMGELTQVMNMRLPGLKVYFRILFFIVELIANR